MKRPPTDLLDDPLVPVLAIRVIIDPVCNQHICTHTEYSLSDVHTQYYDEANLLI